MKRRHVKLLINLVQVDRAVVIDSNTTKDRDGKPNMDSLLPAARRYMRIYDKALRILKKELNA